MNTQEVADKLVQLCREGKNVEAINELYADNIVSHEPKGTPMELTEGKNAVLDKTNQWYAMVEEYHGGSISDPIVSGNFFSCAMDMDVTYKGMGRSEMNEIAVYEVKDGKIVSERFHYDVPMA
ncbi:nuclear transport factor 2 family protein [Mucilaginibacter sabulilitoris]|uniref:Nuclear transport factor 2 family protein n=1 Tax=Mucilaginibacter sabulilitoris TaxID=1173583 RepID=A0ABZ0THL4_9SPHI|nr:nuclear transport factor 2 family protein [Mucilaginibacter sabulilitoris]WPU92685.1 nuclear transport factor 2 family protein [Mucilaginibacter sabulilitoris]